MTSKIAFLDIAPYDGDPTFLTFFKQQIMDTIAINKWSPTIALTYLRSKLVGNALAFYINSYKCKSASSVEEIFQIFKEHFTKSSNSANVLQFQNLKFDPHYNTLSSFINSLNTLAAAIYPMLDDEPLQHIKYVKLIEAIPAKYKLQLLQQKVEKFDQAIDCLSHLVNIEKEGNLIQSPQNSINHENKNMHLQNRSTIRNFRNSENVEGNRNTSDTRSFAHSASRFSPNVHYTKEHHREARKDSFKNRQRNFINKQHYPNNQFQRRHFQPTHKNFNSYRNNFKDVLCKRCHNRGHIARFCQIGDSRTSFSTSCFHNPSAANFVHYRTAQQCHSQQFPTSLNNCVHQTCSQLFPLASNSSSNSVPCTRPCHALMQTSNSEPCSHVTSSDVKPLCCHACGYQKAPNDS